MPRLKRVAVGREIYHVVNRGVGKMRLFESEGDFLAFERCLGEALERYPGVRLLAYCVMGNHWHLVVRPTTDGELPGFMRWLTTTHVRRWLEFREGVGSGPIYQGRYRSFICDDGGFRTVARYVERNPLRANLVAEAQTWRWSSLGQREMGEARVRLAEWPGGVPENWVDRVNAPESMAEVEAIRKASSSGQPYGHPAWAAEKRLRLGIRMPGRGGRPRKERGD